ncbi:MAG: hypothetical protein ACRDHW_00820 [Ktedonobacteraceae bacterium]
MTVYWRDSFARANQSGLGTADSGGTYSLVRGNQLLSIVFNEGVMSFNGSTTTGAVQAGSTAIGDCEMLIRATQNGSTSDLIGVCPRFQNTSNFYSFVQGSTAGQFQLRKAVGGTFSTVGSSFAFASTVGSFFWIRCRVQGTHFLGKIWADGSPEPNTWGIDTTDSSIAGPQTFGIVGTPAASGHTVSFDGFYVIDYLNTDALILSDSFAGESDASPVEALNLTETLAIGIQAQLSESMTIVESVASNGESDPVESLVLLDQNWSTVSMNMVESLAMSDLASSTGIFAPVEALVVSDQCGVDLEFVWVEGLMIVDSFTGISAVPQLVTITWVTRDGNVTWVTRDGNITWRTRG